MNPTFSLTLSFLLFAYISNLSSYNALQQVLDINGNPVVSGNEYYIFRASDNPKSGGLSLSKVGDDLKCPVTILQNNAITGLPVKFTIPKSNTDNILTGTDLEIEFAEKPDCAESSKWLLFVDNNTKLHCVGIGVPTNYPGVETINGKFLIVKHGSVNGYRLGFSLDVTGDCGLLGLQVFSSGEGGSRLILTVTDAYSVVLVDVASVKSENIVFDKGDPNSSLSI